MGRRLRRAGSPAAGRCRGASSPRRGPVRMSWRSLVGLALWGVRGSGKRPHRPAIVAALGTGLAIAGYTTVDGVGVRASGTSLGYVAWLMILEGLAIPAYAYYRHRAGPAAQLRPFAVRGLLGAALSVVAYGLVLWAQTRARLAPIAALRESSIIVGAAIGTLFFKERFGAPRIAAAGLMVVGHRDDAAHDELMPFAPAGHGGGEGHQEVSGSGRRLRLRRTSSTAPGPCPRPFRRPSGPSRTRGSC
ncbi:EamA family transporter [Streptomyces sp. ISL-111]|nr:EamA family transporter [Streptomyces sp. ISL-111]